MISVQKVGWFSALIQCKNSEFYFIYLLDVLGNKQITWQVLWKINQIHSITDFFLCITTINFFTAEIESKWFFYRYWIKWNKEWIYEKNHIREKSTIGEMEPELDDQAEAFFWIVFEQLRVQVLLILFGLLKTIM